MSATNSTPNYGLPQYLPTDKPTYLGDFNKAMLDIDTNMKSIDNKAEGAEGSIATIQATANQALENANTAQQTAEQADTKAEQAGTKADVAKTTADTAKNTANSALNTANNAKTTADNVLSNLNLTPTTYTPVAVSGCTISGTDKITVAVNSDGSIAKIYGNITINNTAQSKQIRITNTPLRPASEFTVNPIGFVSTANDVCYNIRGVVSTNGTITFNVFGASSGISNIIIFPCLYFIKDFGDVN